MERLLEPQLSEDRAEALAKAESDLDQRGGDLVPLFRELFGPEAPAGHALHLGCRSGAATIRFASVYPDCTVHGLDQSAAMLAQARAHLAAVPQLDGRVRFIAGTLPGVPLPRTRYAVLMADHLLHHLEDPQVFWNVVRRHGAAGAPVLVRDFRRPMTHAESVWLVQKYAAGAPEEVRRDLLDSLHAAFEVAELERQLHAARLGGFQMRPIGDMHVAIWGRLPPSSLIGAEA
jgi:SAM-dependent methyltransferase